MMRGYDDATAPVRTPHKAYRVIGSPQGWRVEVNGCVTRAIKDRRAAQRLARALQRERDHLTHAGPTADESKAGPA